MNVLITGGVGFIGTNTVLAIKATYPQAKITIVDNFSRRGVDKNAAYLSDHCSNLEIIKAESADTNKYRRQIKTADFIIHLAGQTAVTTSIHNPAQDFSANLTGGFALLEAVRINNPKAFCIYASTNKVFGDLSTEKIVMNKKAKRYENTSSPNGINESAPLHFISPYGCSKGAIDQYFTDYHRIYGIPTVVFRQSCIYGEYQMGVEDQGWVAHFSLQILNEKPITLFGDGYQVRDLLFATDLTNAYIKAFEQQKSTAGQVFTIGGGMKNSVSLVSCIDILEQYIGKKATLVKTKARPGDQNWFVSDNRLLIKTIGWKPTVSVPQGLETMVAWQQKANL